MSFANRLLFASAAFLALLLFFLASRDSPGAQQKRWEIKVENKTGQPIFVNIQGERPNIVSYPGIRDSSFDNKGLLKQSLVKVKDDGLWYGGLEKRGSYSDKMFEGERTVTVRKAKKVGS